MEARLLEREPVGGGLQRLRFAVDATTASTHVRHGQYVEVSAEQDRGYFAIASAPGERSWDLIVRTHLRERGGMGDRLRALPLHASVGISAAQGPGFPTDDARGRPLMLAATGSAISAVLSTLGLRIAEGAARETYFLYGVRERSEIALPSELSAMRTAGVDVAICLSREHVNEPGFYRGYVQDIAAAHHWKLRDGLVFAAGNDAMIDGMRKATRALGLPEDAVRLNA